MNSIIVDDALIEKFLSRGVDKILPDVNGLRAKLESGERISAYMGFDPSGPYLHVGHAMGIRALRILQQLGHRVIFLVGDYTARVGDPDKGSSRDLLTEEKIAANMAGWKEQAGQLIDFEDQNNPVEFLHNYDWLSKLEFADLIKLMSQFTVQQLLERDLFKKRLAEQKPLQLQELFYPLMQGYDSVAMNVDLELGGTDQIYNMLTGRQLVDNYLHKQKFVRAHKLMPAPDTLTMSKTKGNGINLGDSANDMYGKAMSYKDEHILIGLELLTESTNLEMEEVKQALEKGENPMQYKKLLAFRIVEMIKGRSAAELAAENFKATVQDRSISSDRTKISQELLNKKLVQLEKLDDAVTIVSEISGISKSQTKQLIRQGGVELNGEKLTEGNPLKLAIGQVIKVGKRNYYEII